MLIILTDQLDLRVCDLQFRQFRSPQWQQLFDARLIDDYFRSSEMEVGGL